MDSANLYFNSICFWQNNPTLGKAHLILMRVLLAMDTLQIKYALQNLFQTKMRYSSKNTDSVLIINISHSDMLIT